MIQSFTKVAGASLALAAISAITGCESQGLSSRETGMQTYSNIVYAAPPATANAEPVHIAVPARVSLVQIGEIAPPDAMLTALRARRDLFARVSPQSGMLDQNSIDQHQRLDQMRDMARNLGADYLLVFGGNIDAGHQETPLAVLNLTIVGAFIVPSTVVHVSGKAAGSLVDVRTGQVLMNFSSETAGNGITPSTFADNTQTASVETAKNNLTQKLTIDVITQMSEQTKPTPGVAMVR